MAVSAFWRTTGAVSTDYRLRLVLRDESGQTWAQTEAPLVSADYGSSRWASGQILEGQYDLLVDPEAPSGAYALRGELLDGDRLVADVALASIQVQGRQREYEVPAVQYPADVTLGGTATLLGYDLDTTVTPGQPLAVRLYWRGEERDSSSYTVFVHLIDASDQIWGQVDSIPVQGQYPTSGWLPGEIVADDYAVPVAADAPAGTYRLEIGMYDAATGVRLPLYDTSGARLPNDRYLVEGLSIAAP
jgi:hypothetical protein